MCVTGTITLPMRQGYASKWAWQRYRSILGFAGPVDFLEGLLVVYVCMNVEFL